jgi:4'-phosphopantetheinyl transferase
VRCWRVVVGDIADPVRRTLFALMDEDEQAREQRFVKDSDRRSFTAAHAGLRLALAPMLGTAPRQLRFTQGRFGKPALAGGSDIAFNLSHSGGIVLIAVASGLEIGADVERIRPLPERDDIVRRYLHPGEVADLAAVPEREGEAAFFRLWTRKEAVVKALGRGMNLDLDRYRVVCAPGAAPRLLALEGEAAPDAWTIVDLDPGAGHVGALAARAPSLVVERGTLDLAAALDS